MSRGRSLAVTTAAVIVAAGGTATIAGLGDDTGRAGPAQQHRPGADDHTPLRAAALRRRAPAPRTDTERATRRLRAALGRDAIVRRDESTGGIRLLARRDGFLTPPSRATPERIARSYVREHADVVGLDRRDLAATEVADKATVHGVTHLVWRQTFRGIPVADADLRAAVTTSGRLVQVGGGARHAVEVSTIEPAIDARAARAAVARSAGRPAPRDPVTAAKTGPERETTFASGDTAMLRILAAGERPRLVWRVVYEPDSLTLLDATVDAQSGEVLTRVNRVTAALGGRAHEFFPGAASGGVATLRDLSPWLAPDAERLAGNNAHVFADVNDNDVTDKDEEIPPTEPGSWDYQRTTFPPAGGRVCPSAGCPWNPADPATVPANAKQSATQLFWFVNRFHDHLAGPDVAFTEATGNFQADNAGGAGKPGDALVAHARDGSTAANGLPDAKHLNNANMATYPDGVPPRMQMYLFATTLLPPSATPDQHNTADSADDASVVYHEYAHGLNNRTIKDADGWGALTTRQAGALDEGLADFFALDFLEAEGHIADDPTVDGQVLVAAHLDRRPQGFRTQPTDCPPQSTHGLCQRHYTYADFGKIDRNGWETHTDGEIFTQTLWDLRTRLIADLGRQEGIAVARRLVVGGMRFAPPGPSFLDLRNGILQADRVRTEGGAASQRALIWSVFAARGMGFHAATTNGDDLAPVADATFDPTESTPTGTLSGRLEDRATGAPIAGARVFLASHAGVVPAEGDRLKGATGSDGRFHISGVPAGTYRYVAFDAPGYERVLSDAVDIEPREELQITETARRNWADARAGAVNQDATKEGVLGCTKGGNVTDGVPTSAYAVNTYDHGPRTITIALPAPVKVTSFAVDPNVRCMNGRFSLRRVRIDTAGADGQFAPALRENVGPRREVSELRPPAPIDDVQFVRVRMLDSNVGDAAVGMAEIQVFGSIRQPPGARFDLAPVAPKVGQEVTFDGSQSTAQGGVQRYRWDLDGDGTYETDTGTAATVKKTYTRRGPVDVSLEITDPGRELDTFTRKIYIDADAEVYPVDSGAGGPGNRGTGIAESGWVVGDEGAAAARRGFLFRDGEAATLAPRPGDTESAATSVNDDGVVVGASFGPSGEPRAAVWPGAGDAHDVHFSETGPSMAFAISSTGAIAGMGHREGDGRVPVYKLGGGGTVDVQTAAGVDEDDRRPGAALAINAAGKVGGCWFSGDGQCIAAWLFEGTQLTQLGNTAAVRALNASGVAVGGTGETFLGEERATRWSAAGVPEDLGTRGGATRATDINDKGDVVGWGYDHFNQVRPFLHDATGRTELQDLVEDSSWQLLTATGINEHREITGEGFFDGHNRAYELDLGPCRICVKAMTLEHEVRPGTWLPVGPEGTVDGNRVRANVTIRSDDTRTRTFRAALHDVTRKKEIAAKDEPIQLEPNGELETSFTWDTEGQAWDDAKATPDPDHLLRLRLHAGVQTLGKKTVPIKVRPKPVVLVHGLVSDAATWKAYDGFVKAAHPDWQAFAVGDGRAPGVMNTGALTRPVATPNTVLENAQVLAGYLDAVRTQTGAARVDLIGHSMGGLISRQYIHSEMPVTDGRPPVVAHLVQLGTPNKGSACAELASLPMLYELRRDVMSEFNGRTTQRRGVPFAVYAGKTEEDTCLEEGVPGDDVVAVDSAQWEIEDNRIGATAHTDMTKSGAIFTGFALPRLLGSEPEQASPSPQPTPDPPSGVRRTREARAALLADTPGAISEGNSATLAGKGTETLAAGATARSAPIVVPNGATVRAVVVAGPEVTVVLRRPDGTAADTVPAGSPAAGVPLRVLSGTSPTGGKWRLELHNGGSESSQAAWSALLANDPLRVLTRVGSPGPDGSARVVARMAGASGSIAGGAVTATFVRPRGDGTPVATTLFDDGAHGDARSGDGCFGGVTGALGAGDHLLEVAMTTGGSSRTLLRRVTVTPGGDAPGPVECPPLVRNGPILAMVSLDPDGGTLGDGPRWVDPDTGSTIAPDAGRPMPPRTSSGADVSPDGTRIAYIANRSTDAHDGPYWQRFETDSIWVSRPPGEAGSPIPVTPTNHLVDELAWSPDGKRIAYVNRAFPQGCTIDICDDVTELRVIDVTGENLSPALVTAPWSEGIADPAWTPDGRIAFARRPEWGGRHDLFTIASTGGAEQPLVVASTSAREPAFSPDGADLLFTLGARIWKARANGTGRVMISDPQPGADPAAAHPEWSPDGKLIAFSRDWGLWTMAADGTTHKRLFTAPSSTFGKTAVRSIMWPGAPLLGTQAAPECRSASLSAVRDKPITLTLTCSEPNGDPVALRIDEAPGVGSLTPLDDAGRVTYTPPAGYTGQTSFSFVGSDGALESAPARIALEIVEPPPPPPPPPPPGGSAVGVSKASGGSGGGAGGGGSGGGGGGSGGRGGSNDDWDNVPSVGFSCTVGVDAGCQFIYFCKPGRTQCKIIGSGVNTDRTGGVRAVVAQRQRALVKPLRATVPGGKRKRIAVRLTPAGKSLVRRRGRLRIEVRLTMTRGGKVEWRRRMPVTFVRKGAKRSRPRELRIPAG